MLSAVILAKNEERNLEDCLKSVAFCDEIILVDDYSINKSQISNLKIYKKGLNGDFAEQRNFGLEKARGDWVLFVDADERVSPVLAEEIKAGISGKSGKSVDGFYFKRKDKFLGRWLNYGETANIKLLRVAKKNAGRWAGKVHEEWQIKGKTEKFKNPLLHDRKITIAQLLERINHYSSIRSTELYQQGETTKMFWVTAYPLAKFFHNYVLKLGFLDGIPGFIMAGMMSLHSFMVRAKLWVRQQNRGEEGFKIKNWRQFDNEPD